MMTPRCFSSILITQGARRVSTANVPTSTRIESDLGARLIIQSLADQIQVSRHYGSLPGFAERYSQSNERLFLQVANGICGYIDNSGLVGQNYLSYFLESSIERAKEYPKGPFFATQDFAKSLFRRILNEELPIAYPTAIANLDQMGEDCLAFGDKILQHLLQSQRSSELTPLFCKVLDRLPTTVQQALVQQCQDSLTRYSEAPLLYGVMLHAAALSAARNSEDLPEVKHYLRLLQDAPEGSRSIILRDFLDLKTSFQKIMIYSYGIALQELATSAITSQDRDVRDLGEKTLNTLIRKI